MAYSLKNPINCIQGLLYSQKAVYATLCAQEPSTSQII